MPAARFWRVRRIETYAYGDLALSEIALYEGGVRVDDLATIISELAPSNGSLADLVDENFATVVTWPAASVALPGFGITFDFGVGVTKDITKVGVAGPDRDRFANRFAVEYSSDGIAWTLYKRTVPASLFTSATTFFEVGDGLGPTFKSLTLALEPVGYWRLNDASGSAVNQVSGGVAGTYRGTLITRNASGGAVPDGGYLDLDASGTGAPGVNTNLATDYTSAHSFLCWVKPDASGHDDSATIFAKRTFFADAVSNFPIAFTYSKTTKKLNLALSRGEDFIADASLVSSGALPDDTWSLVGYAYRANGQCDIYINGVLDSSVGIAFAINSAPTVQWTIGSSTEIAGGGANTTTFAGGIAEAALFARSLTPQEFLDVYESRVNTIDGSFDAPPIRPLALASPIVLQGYTPPGSTVIGANFAQGVNLDLEDGGSYRIIGTVKEVALPANLPLARRVRLYEERSGRFIKGTWSDAAGNYAFTNIRGDRPYMVIASDHTDTYRAVVADKLFAELMQ